MEYGDELISLVDLGGPPVANPLEQAGEAAVGGGVLAQQERDLVAVGLDLGALAGSAPRLRDRLAETVSSGKDRTRPSAGAPFKAP